MHLPVARPKLLNEQSTDRSGLNLSRGPTGRSKPLVWFPLASCTEYVVLGLCVGFSSSMLDVETQSQTAFILPLLVARPS